MEALIAVTLTLQIVIDVDYLVVANMYQSERVGVEN